MIFRWIQHGVELLRSAQRLRPHMRGGRRLLGATLGTAIVAALLEMVGVGMLTQVIAFLQGPEAAGGGGVAKAVSAGSRIFVAIRKEYVEWVGRVAPGHGAVWELAGLCVLVIGVVGAKNVFLGWSTMLGIRLRVRMTMNLRAALFRRLQSAELAFFENKKAGEIGSVFYQETNRVALAMEYFVMIAQRGFLALFSLGLLVAYSWQLTVLGILLAVAIGGAVTTFQRRLKRAGRELGAAHQRFGGTLTEAFTGVRIIRALGAQELEQGRFEDASANLSRVEGGAARTSAWIPPVAELIGVAGAMLIVTVAYAFFIREGRIEPAFVFAFGIVVSRLLPMLNQIASLSASLFVAGEGFREVEKWLGTPTFPVEPFGSREFRGVERGIRFEGLGFTYPNGRVALADVSFELPAGKTVALVGESGSGKSTLASLLLRLRRPTAGRVCVDGVDYWEFSSESWHRNLGVVEQEAFLFNDTVEGNLTYGRSGLTTEQVGRAIRTAHLEDVVRGLPEGLRTVVGERGAMLSGGQRQRLAIARAVVSDPPLLILDEATSALDNESERKVQTALEEARHGRTVLVIAHRLSTIRNADHIVVMREGRIVEQGGWEELSARGGVFARLRQSAEFGGGQGMVGVEMLREDPEAGDGAGSGRRGEG